MRRYSSSSDALRRRSLNWEMSAPATKAVSPAPRRITTRIAGSAERSRTYSGMRCHISWLTALRLCGWLKVIQPIGPSFSISSVSAWLVTVSLMGGLSWSRGAVRPLVYPVRRFRASAVSSMAAPRTMSRPTHRDACQAFRWEESARAMGVAAGTPVNLGRAIVDRHAGSGRDALRWFGKRRRGADATLRRARPARPTRFAGFLAAAGRRQGRPGRRLPAARPRDAGDHARTWKVGAVYVPIFTGFGPDAIEFRVRHSGAQVLFTQREYRDRLPAAAGRGHGRHGRRGEAAGAPGDVGVLATSMHGQPDDGPRCRVSARRSGGAALHVGLDGTARRA